MNVPNDIKIYHIVHISKLESIYKDRFLWSYSEVNKLGVHGQDIGMLTIKDRRLQLSLTSRPGLFVGECVPFYFCPRSVMLYLFYRNNHADITYHGGQEPIVHLVSNLRKAVQWAEQNNLRWAFTSSNAGSRYFNDFSDLRQLDQIDWNIVNATQWSGNHEAKQSEFLVEQQFP